MKIIIISQWFDPEPTLKGLIFARALVKNGHEVQVITGFPNYPGGIVYDGYKIKFYQKEIIDGVVIHRVPLYPSHDSSALKRVFNYMSFSFSSLLCGIFKAKKADVIYVYHPPITSGLVALCVGKIRRIPVVIDIQDLWPDTLKATGMVNSEKLISIVSVFCGFIYKYVQDIVVLSPGFKEKLLSRGVSKEKISVIYNWADESSFLNPSVKTSVLPSKGFNVLFAGNIGRAQGIVSIIDAALLLEKNNKNVNIVFVGGGVLLDTAKDYVTKLNVKNVFFIPRVSMQEVSGIINSADALLVHLIKNELFNITIPSKTQSYLLAGKPIIMAVEGDAKDLVEVSKSGFFASPEDSISLYDSFVNVSELPKEKLDLMGTNGKFFYFENLSQSVGVSKFEDVFLKAIENFNK
ncbi:glycosyltransferase family 4 protein [Shewanella sp. KX20019]|uniref:glycosyltransferase family 4 protein n=1 Tax=Shewanella sp. KX20019 TaxID=2803864 RepID=UPI001927BDF9|nr:glycosyltransferase family 4 protein [Shewanella sp. KX20019]QQX81812.1 glycosyltransferase family 4 protein [Shewanella sp. KX20019]